MGAYAGDRDWERPGGLHPQNRSRVCAMQTHMSPSSRYDASSHSVMDTAHRASRTSDGHALCSVLQHDQHASATVPRVQDSRGAGFQPACRHPRYRCQVLAVTDGAPAGRLRHDRARRPPRRHPTRRSALPRRVMRANALPDRVQAPPGLSSSTRGARSPSSDQPRRGFHGVRQGLNPPTRQPLSGTRSRADRTHERQGALWHWDALVGPHPLPLSRDAGEGRPELRARAFQCGRRCVSAYILSAPEHPSPPPLAAGAARTA